MKRRSMLGRRSRAVQQSPLASAFPSQSLILDRVPATPKLPARDRTSPHPFQTPSVDGSLTGLSRDMETWSVFKNTNVPFMKSPLNDGKRRMNLEARPLQTGRLNRLKKNDPLCELRNLGFPKILPKKNGVNSVFGTSSTTFPSVSSYDSKSDKYMLKRDVKGSVEEKENNNQHGKHQMAKESENNRVARELLNLEKKWEHQDIRTVSPPWSNGPNTLSDFNLSHPQPPPRIYVSSQPESPHKPTDFSTTLGVGPLESTVVDRKNELAEEEQGGSFTELETLVEETCDNPQSLDLSTVLGNVSLGVNTIELMDKPNINNLSKTSWGTKYKAPLVSVTEEPEFSHAGKENVPPTDTSDDCCLPPDLDETIKSPSVGSPAGTQSETLFKEYQNRLADLTSKIEAAEKRRIIAEEERRLFEGERKRVFIEFFNFMEKSGTETSQPKGKRRKLTQSSAKKARPSFVASKILKKDFKSPKDAGSFMRTPSQMSGERTTVFVPFTPRSLRKNLNQQFNSIFGS